MQKKNTAKENTEQEAPGIKIAEEWLEAQEQAHKEGIC